MTSRSSGRSLVAVSATADRQGRGRRRLDPSSSKRRLLAQARAVAIGSSRGYDPAVRQTFRRTLATWEVQTHLRRMLCGCTSGAELNRTELVRLRAAPPSSSPSSRAPLPPGRCFELLRDRDRLGDRGLPSLPREEAGLEAELAADDDDEEEVPKLMARMTAAAIVQAGGFGYEWARSCCQVKMDRLAGNVERRVLPGLTPEIAPSPSGR